MRRWCEPRLFQQCLLCLSCRALLDSIWSVLVQDRTELGSDPLCDVTMHRPIHEPSETASSSGSHATHALVAQPVVAGGAGDPSSSGPAVKVESSDEDDDCSGRASWASGELLRILTPASSSGGVSSARPRHPLRATMESHLAQTEKHLSWNNGRTKVEGRCVQVLYAGCRYHTPGAGRSTST